MKDFNFVGAKRRGKKILESAKSMAKKGARNGIRRDGLFERSKAAPFARHP